MCSKSLEYSHEPNVCTHWYAAEFAFLFMVWVYVQLFSWNWKLITNKSELSSSSGLAP